MLQLEEITTLLNDSANAGVRLDDIFSSFSDKFFGGDSTGWERIRSELQNNQEQFLMEISIAFGISMSKYLTNENLGINQQLSYRSGGRINHAQNIGKYVSKNSRLIHELSVEYVTATIIQGKQYENGLYSYLAEKRKQQQ